MSETDRLTNEEEEKQEVLLKARQYLVSLRYEPTLKEEKIRLEAQLDALVEKYPWLVKPEERFVRRGEYRTITPLSLLREQLEQQYGGDQD